MYVYKNKYFGQVIISEQMPDNFTGVRINEHVYLPAVYIPERTIKKLGLCVTNKPTGYYNMDQKAINAWRNNVLKSDVFRITAYSLGNEIMTLNFDKKSQNEPELKHRHRIAALLSRAITPNTVKVLDPRIIFTNLLDQATDSNFINTIKSAYDSYLLFATGIYTLNDDSTIDFTCDYRSSKPQLTRFDIYRINNVMPIKVKYRNYFNDHTITYCDFTVVMLKRLKDRYINRREIRYEVFEHVFNIEYEDIHSVLQINVLENQAIIFTPEFVYKLRTKLINNV